jgi:hypothetical protein
MKHFFILCSLIAVVVSLGSMSFVSAATGTPTAPCTKGNLCNPLKFNDIQTLIPEILKVISQLGLIVCTFFIILAGFKYVTAGGDSGKIQTAHNILLWSVVGTAVLLGASVLASILGNTVNQVLK